MVLAGGIVAPVAFVVSWAIAGAREPGYSAVEDHLSGLAAVGASTAWLMIGAFVVLGIGAIAFGVGLARRRPDATRSARIIVVAGAATILVGAFRRDCPFVACGGDPTWHNLAHDLVSAPAFAGLIFAPWFMPVHRRASRAVSLLALGAVLLFATQPDGWGGALQRGIATVPLVWLSAMAWILAGQGPTGAPADPLAPAPVRRA